MNIEDIRNFCLSFSQTEECFPFDESTLVFKVRGKMFCLTDLDNTTRINIKCNPEEAIELREKYHFVEPGYHMNKKHWNTVHISQTTPPDLIKQWITNSYTTVVASLPKRIQKEIYNTQ